MKKAIFFIAILVALFYSCNDNRALAQSIDFNIGWYGGIKELDLIWGTHYSRWTVQRKGSYQFGLHFGRFFDVEKKTRLGIRLNFNIAESEQIDPSKEKDELRDGV